MVKKKKTLRTQATRHQQVSLPYQSVNRWRGSGNVTDRNESPRSVTQALFALAANAR